MMGRWQPIQVGVLQVVSVRGHIFRYLPYVRHISWCWDGWLPGSPLFTCVHDWPGPRLP